jgi:hypothetical protein
MTVLREGRMAGNVPVETQLTESSASQIKVDFLAQPPFGTNATGMADKQHPRANNRMSASTGFAYACPDCPL